MRPTLPPVDLSGGVAVRVAALCLDDGGRPSQKLLCGTAVRAGLLLDLALAGRIESAEDSIGVDPAPTGFVPADLLLAAIAVEPERSLDGWLDEKRIGLREVAAANVASGRWESRSGPFGFGRRYTDLHAAETERDRTRRTDDELHPWSALSWSAADACVTAVAVAAGLENLAVQVAARPPQTLLAATGAVGWLAAAAVDHLVLTYERYSREAAALGAGTVGPF